MNTGVFVYRDIPRYAWLYRFIQSSDVQSWPL